jgi:hypothetical protein
MINIDLEDDLTTALLPFCSDASEEIHLIKQTFANVVKNQGLDQWNPFFVFFDTPFKSHLIVQSKNVQGYENILLSISEVFSLYPAMNAHSAILVLDATVKDDLGNQTDALKLFFVCSSSCVAVTIPYEVNGNDVSYIDSEMEIETITTDHFTDSYKDLYVIMFTYSHIDSSPYSESEVCSYLTYSGHYLQHLHKNSHQPYFSFNP